MSSTGVRYEPAATSPRQSIKSPISEKAFDNWFEKDQPAKVGVNEISTDDAESGRVKPSHSNRPDYIRNWPNEPEALSPIPPYYLVIFDILLALSPVLLIVYGIAAAFLHGKPTNSNYFMDGTNISGDYFGPVMIQAQNFIPTIFPMIFGIEIARLTRNLALYRAERGSRLGYIEQLMGSTSLAGTLSSIWGLWILNWVGIALLVVWCLSPVGGQIGLRIISNNGTVEMNTSISYMSSNATPTGLEGGTENLPYYRYAVDSLYASSLLMPSSLMRGQDPWTNVKIPSIEWLENNNGCGQDGWCSFENIMKKTPNLEAVHTTAGTYSSLTGVPVVGGYYGLGVEKFSLETSYYTFKCNEIREMDQDEVFTSSIPGRAPYKAKDPLVWDSGYLGYPNTFFIDTFTPIDSNDGDSSADRRRDDADLSARQIMFASQGQNRINMANCTMALAHVQSEVMCNFTNPLWTFSHQSSGLGAAGACAVSRMRNSTLDVRTKNWTPLDGQGSVAENFFNAWPGATGPIPKGSSSPTEKFLVEVSTNPVAVNIPKPLVAADWLGYQNPSNYVDITILGRDTFTERFGLLFNTYWHSFCNLQAMTETEIGLGFMETMPPHVMFNTTDVHMIVPGQLYVVNFACLAVFFVCSVIALAAGILAVVLSYKTLVPNILGRVSTMTRNNPFTPVPSGASTLDGDDFGRRVRTMPVRFVDVRPEGEVGSVALSVVGEGTGDDGRWAPLTRGRLYA